MDLQGILGPIGLCLGVIVAAAVLYAVIVFIKGKISKKDDE